MRDKRIREKQRPALVSRAEVEHAVGAVARGGSSRIIGYRHGGGVGKRASVDIAWLEVRYKAGLLGEW